MAKEDEKKSVLEKELFVEKKSAWEVLSNEKGNAFKFCEDYKKFLDENKTEREIVAWVERLAKENGFVELKKATSSTKKIYAINHHKNIVLINLGKGKLSDGIRIIGAHIDTLRLDLKLNPLYESEPFLMINLHYYGGIKKYQWLNVPLEMRGIVFNKNNKPIEINLGGKKTDPVFVISDLLPHLEGSDWAQKAAKDIIKGEELDAIGASIPINDKKIKEKIKATFLKALNDKYKVTEHDFVSAELGLYPSIEPRDVGIDYGLIGAPAHDDRICSYAAVKSIIESKEKNPKAILLVDKEEIGSVGNTSMESLFFENFLEKLLKLIREDISAKEVLSKSKAISADVTNGMDPKFLDKIDPTNVNKSGYGVAVEKYTGAGGKYSASDANAEYMSWIRQMLDASKIPWQFGELGKVDQGGGGTISYLLAKYNMDIIDMGPPVLAMHSPFEIVSKIDCYATYKAYKAFFEYESK